MNNQVNEIILIAEKAYKNKNYLRSYSLYKAIYKKYDLVQIIPRLVDIAFLTLKQTNIKLVLITNIINIGLKKNNITKFLIELYFLKLKLLREFKKFSQFDKLYNSLQPEYQNFIFTKFEYLHYLLETEQYTEAEDILTSIQKSNINFYKIADNFFLNKKFFDQILDSKLEVKHDIISHQESINSQFDYIVVLVGNPEIFEEEIIKFIKSLKKTSSRYLISLLIHDANNEQIKLINQILKSLQIENLSILFENSNKLNLDSSEIKAYYTARRYILANDMMERFLKTTFVFDADYVINKNLYNYVKLNSKIDMSLCIKKSFRYLHLTISAGQSMFNCTDKSKIFLNFYKKYVYYILNYRRVTWHIDQIILHVAFIFAKRYFNATIIGNLDKNHYENKECFFFHTFHNKYKLRD